MAKSRRGKRAAAKAPGRAARPAPPFATPLGNARPATTAGVNRRLAGGSSWQNLVFAVMVALGCWGMTLSFIFFYTGDPNHYLYAGMAAIMALIWTFSAVLRIRKTLAAGKT